MKKNNHLNLAPKTKRHLIQTGVVIFVIIFFGIALREYEFIKLRAETEREAVLSVVTVKATPVVEQDEIVLPGTVTGWHDATIYARTSGYLEIWKTDIGTHVKEGELLAVISAPEINAQLRQTEADLKTAMANYELAKATEKRWLNLYKTNSVSKQSVDENVSDAKAKQAMVISTAANRDRLRHLVDFQKIMAPFAGVIMSRTTDIGRLINAGSNSSVPLFRIVQTNPLRVYVRVPQNYAALIPPNMQAKLYFSEHPGKSYSATLLNTANAIDPVTHTLLVQFITNNPNQELLPGGYVQVHLLIEPSKNSVRVPVNALLFYTDQMQVATIDNKQKVVLKQVKISRDYGSYVEVAAGLTPNESIIINPPDSLMTGQAVRVIKQSNTQEKMAV